MPPESPASQGGAPAQSGGNQGHPAGAHLEPSRWPPAPPCRPGARGRGHGGSQGQERHTYSDGSKLFLSMAEDIGEGGGVPGGGGAPFVARYWPAAGARTPSGAPAPPLLRLLLLRRSGGELAPPRSRTVTALPSNAKERERITGLPARRGRGGDRGAQPGPGRLQQQLGCSGLNLPSRSRRRHPVQLGSARALSPAPRRPRGWCAPAGPPLSPHTFGRVAARSWPLRAGRGRPGGGEGTLPFSPGSLLSREGLFSLSFPLSLVSFPFS